VKKKEDAIPSRRKVTIRDMCQRRGCEWYKKKNTDTDTNTVEKSVVERMKRDVCWRKGGGGWNVGNVRRAGA